MRGTGSFPVVLLSDPAIDYAASNFEAFLRERDPAHLVYHEGEQPTVFHCRVLTLQERRDVRNKASDADRHEAAFVRGLEKVDAVRNASSDRPGWYRSTTKDGKQRNVPDSDLEDIFSESQVQEVGSVIWHRSSLPLYQGCAVTYPLLDISQRALMVNRPRSAVAPTQSASDKPHPAEPPQATPAT